MHRKSFKSSAILRVFPLILICFFFIASATAQEKVTSPPSAQPQTIGMVASPSAEPAAVVPAEAASQKQKAEALTTTSTPAAKSNSNKTVASTAATKSSGGNDNPADDYTSSLNTLSTLYQSEVQRLEKQNNQSKDLYNEGLISRVALEGSDKALAEARAKVEEVARQIAAANQPATTVNMASDLAASDHAWTTGNLRLDGLIRYNGNQYGVDPFLVYCLMSQESKFLTNATSPKGAQGLMQLMPGTAARYGVTNPYDVAQSIMGGTRYLKDLLKMFNGRVDLALAGYNAGENAVIKYGYTVPPYDETRNYVRLIVARYGKKRTQSAPARAL
jgi:soluble lytic murein transglycosylase-like protein